MFTVEYEGQQYKVRFEHTHETEVMRFDAEIFDAETCKWTQVTGITVCEIRTMIGCVGYGVTFCSLSDPYNGITGEKIALARALKQMTDHGQDLIGSSVDREFRLAFWKAWFSTLKGKRTEKARKSFSAQLGA